MFISNEERLQFKKSIEKLFKLLEEMITDTIELRARIKVLEGKKPPVKKKLTEAQRIKQREYAKRYQAKKRLEKKNGNSVSTTSV